MNIKTSYPVIVKGQVINATKKDYSNLDGSSPSKSISAYQKWYNGNRGGKLKVDGKWGPKTSAAWADAGADYDTFLKDTIMSIQGNKSGGGASPAEAQPKKTKGKLLDKAKNLFGKAKDAGVVDAAKNAAANSKLGQKLGGKGGAATAEDNGNGGGAAPDLGKEGMTKQTKIIIGVVIGAVVIFFLFKALKK